MFLGIEQCLEINVSENVHQNIGIALNTKWDI